MVNIDTDEKRRLRELLFQEEDEQNEEEKEKAKKNKNFVQVYRQNMPELRWLMAKSGIASSLLFFILEHMDNKNYLKKMDLLIF